MLLAGTSIQMIHCGEVFDRCSFVVRLSVTCTGPIDYNNVGRAACCVSLKFQNAIEFLFLHVQTEDLGNSWRAQIDPLEAVDIFEFDQCQNAINFDDFCRFDFAIQFNLEFEMNFCLEFVLHT